MLKLPNNTYLEGFFQSERYFADIVPEIRQRFRLVREESALPAETRRLANQIRTKGGVCVNVRRGDYVTNPVANRYHGVAVS